MDRLAAWGRKTAGRRRLLSLLLGLFLAALVWTAQALGAFAPLDRKLLDTFFLARFVIRGEQETLSSIIIVAIDYESLQRVEHRWPWPRSIHAQLIRKLSQAGARVVAFDVLFLDADPVHDADLAKAAEEAGNVVWASTFIIAGEQRYKISHHSAPTAALLVPSAIYGFVGLPFDPDGYVRRMDPFHRSDAHSQKSFDLVISERYEGHPILSLSADGKHVLGPNNSPIRLEKNGSLLINFTGPPATFPTIPYIRVLDGKTPPQMLKDKIVIVGATAEPADSFFTPLYSSWWRSEETRHIMPGVEIHANAVNMLLRGDYLEGAGRVWNFFVFLMLGLALSFIPTQRRKWLAAAGLLTLVLGVFWSAGYLTFDMYDLWLAVAGPMASAPIIWGGLAFSNFLFERKEKNFVRSTLELYVSPAVVQEVISRGIDLAPGGKRQTITILFSDIRGFTGLSERLSPEEMVEILNQHFTASSEIILNSGGTLDKFIGDAVMAFWGAPAPREDHALAAVKAAIAMQTAAKELDKIMQARWREQFRIGIGINSGDAVVGHIGSPRRMGYTAVGDPTNLASRCEGLTKDYPAEILITRTTYSLVKDHVEVDPLGEVPVKGRTETTAIYRVIRLKEN